jgi:hypothetical protein
MSESPSFLPRELVGKIINRRLLPEVCGAAACRIDRPGKVLAPRIEAVSGE